MPSENYLGNPNLKNSNVQIEFTSEQVKELLKCSTDPKYFIENYVQIVHVDHGLVPFKLYEYQERMIETFHNNRFAYIGLFHIKVVNIILIIVLSI